jgi:hypothetical protein
VTDRKALPLPVPPVTLRAEDFRGDAGPLFNESLDDARRSWIGAAQAPSHGAHGTGPGDRSLSVVTEIQRDSPIDELSAIGLSWLA